MSAQLLMNVYRADATQSVLTGLARATNRIYTLWEGGAHTVFHYGFLPALTLGGLHYTGDLSLGMLIASVNPLLL